MTRDDAIALVMEQLEPDDAYGRMELAELLTAFFPEDPVTAHDLKAIPRPVELTVTERAVVDSALKALADRQQAEELLATLQKLSLYAEMDKLDKYAKAELAYHQACGRPLKEGPGFRVLH